MGPREKGLQTSYLSFVLPEMIRHFIAQISNRESRLTFEINRSCTMPILCSTWILSGLDFVFWDAPLSGIYSRCPLPTEDFRRCAWA